MNKQFSFRRYLVLSTVALLCSTLVPTSSVADAAYTAPTSDDRRAVTLTEVHGNVFKRGFIDFIKQIFGNPIPAKMHDKLHDGTQVGTGQDSWAQLTWPEVVARTWANTVVQIMPNKRIVYLADGEMLFRLKKDSDTSSDYSIWTKVLQTRVRGTSLILQRTPNVTRLTVLEGHVEAKNLIDQSEVQLGPGAVYEVRTPFEKPKEQSTETTPQKQKEPLPWDENFQPITPRRLVIGESPDKTTDWVEDAKTMRVPEKDLAMPIDEIDLFKTPASQSCLKVADAEALSEHPLLKDFSEKLDSTPMIDDAFKKLPNICFRDRLPKVANPLAERNRLLLKEASVSCGPAGSNVKVGRDLGYQFSLPSPVAAGETPEKLPIVRTSTPHSTYTPSGNFQSGSYANSNSYDDAHRQCTAAWKAYNDFKQFYERDKQDKFRRLQSEQCNSPEECQRKKDMFCRWEKDQEAHLKQLEQAATLAKQRADNSKRPFTR